MSKHTIAILLYNNHDISLQMIKELREKGNQDHIFVFDNGSTPSFEGLIDDDNMTYYRSETNLYVNPAWNKIFDMVDTTYLTLLNNDCFIQTDNYFTEVISHMDKHEITLSSCKTRNVKKYTPFIKSFYKYLFYFGKFFNLTYSSTARRQGWLMTINLDRYKTLDYLIPNYLNIWYGDDWIYSQILIHKLTYAIYKNRYALHVRGLTSSTLNHIIDNDTSNLNEHGEWYKNTTTEMHSKSYV